MSDPITPALVAEHGLQPEEYERILAILGRAPNLVELGIFSVMWSEHCSYKSSKIHLGKFPTEAPWVVCGPGENAGVVDIGDGLVAVFKMESHNHPSFIEPYQGAATGVGGILRDVFTMGARPVALLDALRFGDPAHPKTRHLLGGVVAGIGGYGNCVGVPTVGGECTFHRAYNGNILVNAMCVGVARADRVFYAKASGVGNPVVYVGAKTGRDGIHGATMASAEFSDETEAKRPTVQVGDPFTEKLLIEACLELMEKDCIVAIQDMGAAGLTSSSFEMAARGERRHRARSRPRCRCARPGMTPYEIMLSESQERMLMVLEDGREAEALGGLRQVGPGLRRDRPRHRQRPDGAALAGRDRGRRAGGPGQRRLAGLRPPARGRRPGAVPLAASDREAGCPHREALLRLLGSPDLASKRWIWEQYDHMVMGDTVQRPGGDAAVVRVHGTRPRPGAHHRLHAALLLRRPATGRRQAVAEAWRNLVAVGARPLAITNCLNFGNPERPRGHGPARSAASRAWPTPAARSTSRSSRATSRSTTRPTATRSCPPPMSAALGVIDDLRRAWSGSPGTGARASTLILLGECLGWLGSSLYLAPDRAAATTGRRRRWISAPSAAPASSCWRRSRPGRVRACHDLSDGGLAVAAGRDVPGQRHRRRRSSCRTRPSAPAGGSARIRAAICRGRAEAAPSSWPRPRPRACSAA